MVNDTDESNTLTAEACFDGDMWQGRAPDNLTIDVEAEMRKNVSRDLEGVELERALDDRIYQWWKDGKWFGAQDASGEYQPSQIDEDNTSVISVSTAASSNAERSLT